MSSVDKPVVLVLGGSGLLGYHCYQGLKNNYNVIMTYNKHNLDIVNCEYFDVFSGEEALLKLLNKHRPDVIINNIAYVTVEGCESNPILAEKLNSDFVSTLVTSLKKAELENSHLIHISSDSVYGLQSKGLNQAWVETDSVNPISIYSKTKLAGERFASQHFGNVSILRVAFYGINPKLLHESGLLGFILSNAVVGKMLDGWTNVYFTPISASSLVSVMDVMIKNNTTGIYNVGSTDSCNKYDFVEAVCSHLDLTTTINKTISNPFNEKVIRPDFTVLNSEKLSVDLSLTFSWQKDLDEYLSSYDEKSIKEMLTN